MKFAIIETGGKQYKITAGQTFKVEKLKPTEAGKFVFDKVLLIADGSSVEIGMPYVKGAKVEVDVVGDVRDKKKLIFKYHSKTRYRRRKGHRQTHTQVTATTV